MADTEVLTGDTLPVLDAFLMDGDIPVDLTGCTVRVTAERLVDAKDVPVTNFAYGPLPPPAPLVKLLDAQTVYIGDAPQGYVWRPWAQGETDVPGRYIVRWAVYSQDGRRTYPTTGAQRLDINIPAVPARTYLDPEDVAEEHNLGTLTPQGHSRLSMILASVVADVESYLHRSIEIGQYTEDLLLGGGMPSPGTTYSGVLADLWPVTNLPLIQVLDYVALNSGYFRITYLGGIDGHTKPGIDSYISAHAAARFRKVLTGTDRIASSLTVEGQSASYTSTIGVDLPDIKTIDRWRVRQLYTRPRMSTPYGSR